MDLTKYIVAHNSWKFNTFLQDIEFKGKKVVHNRQFSNKRIGVDKPMVNVKPVHLGKNVRMSFSRIDEVLEMPNLIEVQKNSYKWFLEEGLKEVFKDISEISDYQGNLVLDFIDYRLDETPKYVFPLFD